MRPKRNPLKQNKSRSSAVEHLEHKVFKERNLKNTKMPQTFCVVGKGERN